MWKRNDAPMPQPQNTPAAPKEKTLAETPMPSAPAIAAVPGPAPERPRPAAHTSHAPSSSAMTIGSSVVIKGEVSAREDLTIAGRVEGRIEVRDHVVRVARESTVQAEVFGRAVVVEGTVKGNITATERIELLENGSVEGDISAPKVAMSDGAQFRGKIDMGNREAAKKSA